MSPALLDASFLIALEREIESGRAGAAVQWLLRNRRLPDRPLLVSSVTVAEFLEGFEDETRGLWPLSLDTCRSPWVSITRRNAPKSNGVRE